MSEQLPIKVAPSPQPSNNKVPATASNDDVSTEKQKEFGGVLSNQIQQQDVDKSQKQADNKAVSSKSASGQTHVEGEEPLPQDGNGLPMGPELLELASSESDIELVTTTETIVDPELISEEIDTVALAAPIVAIDSKPVVAATLKVASEKAETPATTTRLTPATVVAR